MEAAAYNEMWKEHHGKAQLSSGAGLPKVSKYTKVVYIGFLFFGARLAAALFNLLRSLL